jgi:hypothetical protein
MEFITGLLTRRTVIKRGLSSPGSRRAISPLPAHLPFTVASIARRRPPALGADGSERSRKGGRRSSSPSASGTRSSRRAGSRASRARRRGPPLGAGGSGRTRSRRQSRRSPLPRRTRWGEWAWVELTRRHRDPFPIRVASPPRERILLDLANDPFALVLAVVGCRETPNVLFGSLHDPNRSGRISRATTMSRTAARQVPDRRLLGMELLPHLMQFYAFRAHTPSVSQGRSSTRRLSRSARAKGARLLPSPTDESHPTKGTEGVS